jgi:hypothetical protein
MDFTTQEILKIADKIRSIEVNGKRPFAVSVEEAPVFWKIEVSTGIGVATIELEKDNTNKA